MVGRLEVPRPPTTLKSQAQRERERERGRLRYSTGCLDLEKVERDKITVSHEGGEEECRGRRGRNIVPLTNNK